jgi:TonB family protein
LRRTVPEKTDISQQIKKYLNGKLDAHAMHELERHAQDDPFLMDALEGYQNTPVDMDAGINELTGRLQQRTEKKEARIIPWRAISIAASILILLGLGLLWYSERQPSQVQKVIAVTLPVQKPATQQHSNADSVSSAARNNPATTGVIPPNKNRLVVNRRKHNVALSNTAPAFSPPAVSTTQPAATYVAQNKVNEHSASLNEVVVTEYAAQKKAGILAKDKIADTTQPTVSQYMANTKADTAGFKDTRIKGTDIAKLDESQRGSNANAALSGMAKPNMLTYTSQQVQMANEIVPLAGRPLTSSMRGYFSRKASVGGIAPLNPVIVHGKMVTGMVKESGEPVEYATVKIKGTTISTLTDSKGKFTLYAVPDSAIIQVLGDGSVLKEAKVTRRDMQLIELHLTANSLNNGAAIAPLDNGIIDYSRPRPSNGWDDMNTYLQQNAISPDGKTGVVKVSFTVNPDNTLSDFKIVQSLSTQADNAAIKLIKDGPGWYSSSDDKAQAITIRIKFHLRDK